MRARVEDDAQGKRLVYEACFEPCAIEKGMRLSLIHISEPTRPY